MGRGGDGETVDGNCTINTQGIELAKGHPHRMYE